MNRAEMLARQRKAKRLLSLLLFVAATLFSVWFIEFDIMEFLSGIPLFLNFLFVDFMPPNLDDLSKYLQPVLDTLAFGVVATVLSSVIALIIAFLMAHNTSPHPVVRVVLRSIISFIRNVPFLVWAAILVVLFGVGTMPGIFALILLGIGFLSRLYAESIEEIDKHAVEAVEATGATYLQKLRQAIIPQFMPGYISWTLFMFEITIRASAILGIVGAGGIGSQIKLTMDLFQYSSTATVVVIMIIMILVVEYVTQRIRERLL
ncbi:phosphonate ABC transporter, permease protein PhnE [Cohnella thailandensis]|uniref:Phosphonate ABC transporter, permease protein PhnE n=1 Tax=Cohnella thailandensis TaxID=557557 RepID=A0A841SQD2_9BACL|nr:phosphonate ABC transporter, permease protein PhnE [Cohnella thailandensis]MBB6633069.1 phosphonate ABC transporter, permease protein PhnE [Cohnella thailandensis]MBP1975236.1 phosphonate transport system permease protein [Cohnella thailandensis]